MKSFSTRQPRFLVLCASVAVSGVLFSGIASTFQHAGDSTLCMARMAQFEHTQSTTQARAASPALLAEQADSRLAANGIKNNAKL